MAKETSKPAPDEEETLPEDDTSDELQDTPVSLKKKGDQPGMKDEWKKVEAIIASAQKAYGEGIPFVDVVETIIQTLTDLKNQSAERGFGGFGGGPEMDIDRSQDEITTDA